MVKTGKWFDYRSWVKLISVIVCCVLVDWLSLELLGGYAEAISSIYRIPKVLFITPVGVLILQIWLSVYASLSPLNDHAGIQRFAVVRSVRIETLRLLVDVLELWTVIIATNLLYLWLMSCKIDWIGVVGQVIAMLVTLVIMKRVRSPYIMLAIVILVQILIRLGCQILG